jgi:hypothetical protein
MSKRISTEDLPGLTPDEKFSIVLTRSHITKNVIGDVKNGSKSQNNKRRRGNTRNK